MISSRVREVAKKIEKMEVRGAGNIARSAAEGIKLSVEGTKSRGELVENLERAKKLLLNARPSAVSLINTVEILTGDIENNLGEMDFSDLREIIVERVEKFVEESKKATQEIGKNGSQLISDGDTVITHCHSSNFISIIDSTIQLEKDLGVIVTETRPRYQGRKTARELIDRGVPVMFIVDSAAGYFMKDVEKLIVGASGIGENGSILSKIGTFPMACVAKKAEIPVIVVAETFKFYHGSLTENHRLIDERKAEEIIDPGKIPGANIRNPPFDITPATCVDKIVTERGVISPEEANEISGSVFLV